MTFRRPIIAFASFMGTTTCYWLTLMALALCTAAVMILGQSSPTAVSLIYGLSVFSIIQASTILVAQHAGEMEARRRDEAMHLKLDSLLRGVDKADNRLIGIEQAVDEET